MKLETASCHPQRMKYADASQVVGFIRMLPSWWFRGGLEFKAHRLVYHTTLGSRVIKRKITIQLSREGAVCPRSPPLSLTHSLSLSLSLPLPLSHTFSISHFQPLSLTHKAHYDPDKNTGLRHVERGWCYRRVDTAVPIFGVNCLRSCCCRILKYGTT